MSWLSFLLIDSEERKRKMFVMGSLDNMDEEMHPAPKAPNASGQKESIVQLSWDDNGVQLKQRGDADPQVEESLSALTDRINKEASLIGSTEIPFKVTRDISAETLNELGHLLTSQTNRLIRVVPG
jgi:hypothetical protein